MAITEKEIALYHSWVEDVVNKDRLELADTILHPDYVMHFSNASFDWPTQREMFRKVKLGFPDWKEEILDMIVDGDKYSIRLMGSGTHLGEYLGFPPSGNKMKWFMVSYGRFEDGRLREQWTTSDSLNLLSQIGVDLKHIPLAGHGKFDPESEAAWRGNGYGK